MTPTLIPLFIPIVIPILAAALRLAVQALRVVAGRARHGVAAWRRHREARATRLTLQSLDNRVLRDLGIDRSELLSIALNPTDGDRVRRCA